MPGDLQLRLYRDALSTPWGFRLQGGKDVGAPLIVQKVNLGTPSDGELYKGDAVLEIQGCDTSRMTHLDAQDKIRNAGGSLLLRVLRFPSYTVPQTPPQKAQQAHSTAKLEFGIDYNRSARSPLPVIKPKSQPGFMLSRVQESLSGPVEPNQQDNQTLEYQDDLSKPWNPSSQQSGDGKVSLHIHHFQPHQALTPNQHNRRRRENSPPDDQPAWLGSLRSSGQPLLCDMSVVPQPPTFNPCVERTSPVCRTTTFSVPPMTDAARGVHLQYNSPLGLYSKSTAQESLSAQLQGTHLEDTIKIIGDSETVVDPVSAVSQSESNAGFSDF
jgi:hypothetical protein